MAYFFDEFSFEPGSRMTGVWPARTGLDPDEELVAMASLVELGRDQHDVLESNFLGSHLPFHFGGFHGAGPDGRPWAVMLQVAPVSAAPATADPYWPLFDGLDRACHYNWEATQLANRCLSRDDLVDAYVEGGVAWRELQNWTVDELMLGLLAQCCYVSLPQIVAGRITQCAFPDLDHECQHDVFADVFAMWGSGQLSPPEPDPEPPPPRPRVRKGAPSGRVRFYWPEKTLRKMSTKKLRKRALRGYWAPDEVSAMTRKQLIALLSTPHKKNLRRA